MDTETDTPGDTPAVSRRKIKPLPFLRSFAVSFDQLTDREIVEFCTDIFVLFFDRREPPRQTTPFLRFCFDSAKSMLNDPRIANDPTLKKFYAPLVIRAIFDTLKSDRNKARFIKTLCSFAFDGVEPDLTGELKVAFENAKQAIADENARRERISEARRNAGLISAQKRASTVDTPPGNTETSI